MSMIGTRELARALYDDAEVARGFALRGSGRQDFVPSQSVGPDPYAASFSGYSPVESVSLPGVRLMPRSDFGSF